jgi:hypothetical protein
LANHFRVKWLNGSPNLLLEIPKIEPVTIPVPDAATTVSHETTTTTTAIPAPANTAAPATYETTERVDRVAGARHVIATSAAPPTQTALEPTTTTAISNTAIEQQDNGELVVRRAEEQENMVERNGEQRTEAREESNPGEQEVIQQTQSEVRDPAASPTGHITVDPAMHEPVRFDWASEVYEALDLSPIGRDTTHPTPANSKLAPRPPENPVPGDVPVDPVRTRSANAAPSSPAATQLIQSPHPPPQLDRATPKPAVTPQNGNVAPRACTPATGVPSVRTPAVLVPINPVPVDPDPDDVATNPAGVALAKTEPTNRMPINPVSAALAVVPDPSNEPVNPTSTVPANAIPVDPDPVNPNFVTTNDHTPAASVINSVPVDPDPGNVADPIRIAFASAVPIDPDPIIHLQFDCFRRHYSCVRCNFQSLFSLAGLFFTSASWKSFNLVS